MENRGGLNEAFVQRIKARRDEPQLGTLYLFKLWSVKHPTDLNRIILETRIEHKRD